MGSPYRGGSPEPEEPVPDFGVRRYFGWRDFLLGLLYVLLTTVPFLLSKDPEQLSFAFWMRLVPMLVVLVAVLLLHAPVSKWREKRYATQVAIGVMKLEEKIEQIRVEEERVRIAEGPPVASCGGGDSGDIEEDDELTPVRPRERCLEATRP